MTITVLETTPELAKLEARRADDTLYAAYTYDAERRYFGKISYYDPSGTEVGYEATITQGGNSFTGELVRWELRTVFEEGGAIAGANQFQTLGVPLTITDVYAEILFECTSGAFIIGVAPMPIVHGAAGLEDRGMGSTDGACPLSMAFAGPVGAPKATVPGTGDEQWGIGAEAAPGSAGTYAFTVLLRTLQTFKVGEAKA